MRMCVSHIGFVNREVSEKQTYFTPPHLLKLVNNPVRCHTGSALRARNVEGKEEVNRERALVGTRRAASSERTGEGHILRDAPRPDTEGDAARLWGSPAYASPQLGGRG